MKSLDVLLYLLCMAGALAGYFLLAPPLSFVVIGLCLAFAVWTVLAADNSGKIVLRLGGLSWTMEDFVRGWLITGRTGSGKTQCAINTITFQLFQNVKNWGGVCLDQKGLYWEILVKMAAHFGREHDLVLLQTRPPGEDALWRPPHTINITGNENVPASTYAKVIVDTAVSLTGGRGGNPFFPTKAQLAIQTGFEILRHMEAYVTIPNIHRLLLHEEDANAAIETLMNKGDQRSHELVRRFAAISNSRPSNLVAFRERSAPILNFSPTRKSPRCSARTSRHSPSPRSTPAKSSASRCRRSSRASDCISTRFSNCRIISMP